MVTSQGHTGIPGYAYISGQCLTCHPDGRVGSFTAHDAAFFPVYSGTHAGQWSACSACHTDPTTRSVYSCTTGGCHAQSATTQGHTGIPGYQWASTQCLTCHPDGRVGTFTAHDATFFPIYSGTHAGQWTVCAACHTDPTTRSVYSCTTGGCHAQATTTQGHTGVTGYQYASAQCLSCHPDGRVPTFTAHDAAYFPIYSGTHTGQWSACSACHTDPTTRTVYSCVAAGCHAQTVTTQGHTGVAGYQYVSAQCLTCHPDGRVPTYTAHDATYFPIYSGTHTGQWSACSACHTDPTTRTVYSCVAGGCHAQTATTQGHTGIPGYQWTSAQCLSCHPDGRVGAFPAHDASFFPIYSGTHAGQWAACAACHTDPTTRAVYSCIAGGCHAQTVTTQGHTGIPGYQWASAQCLTCHPDGRVGTFTAHDAAFFPVYSGTHAGQWAACAACHTDPTTRSVYSCIAGGCHVQPTTTQGHTGVTGYQYADAQCLSCHPDGRVPTFTAHDASYFPIYSGTHVGQWSACSACHTDPTSRAIYSCTTGGCHAQPTTTQGHTGVTGYQYADAQCLSCHPDGRVPTFTAHDASYFPIYSGTHLGQWSACSACHTDPTTRSVYSCIAGGCHVQAVTTQGHTGVPGYQWTSAQCLSCHPDGRVPAFTAHDASYFPIYSGSHAGQWTACAACHTDPTTRAVYSCVAGGCHAQAVTTQGHTGIPGYQWASAQCLSCHPTGLVGTFTAHDASFFPIYSGTHAGQWTACAACHTDPTTRSVFSCTTGGCHAQATTTQGHTGVTGYQYADAQCLSCHPDGRVPTFTAHDASYFPIYSGTHVNQWSACSACHTDPTSRAIYSCTTGGCHAQPTTTQGHTGVTGYQYADAQCLSCHPDGRVPTFTAHDASYFPIYSGTHLNQWSACSACHTDPTTRAVYSCTTGGCHAQVTTTQGHTGVTGYQYVDAQCLSCHPDGRVPTFTAHDASYFPIYSGTHAGQWSACAACHTDPTTRAVYSCTAGGCHAQTATTQGHTGIPGYQWASAQCLTCHPTGLVGTFTAHDATFFPIYSGTHAGQWTACAACHTDPTTRAVYSCVTAGCHAQAATNLAHTGIPSYGYTSAQCLACHPTGVRGTFTQHDALFFPIYSGTHAGRWASCLTCHTTAGNPTIFTCMSSGCHPRTQTNSDHSGTTGYQYIAAACYSCHPRGSAGNVAPRLPTPQRPILPSSRTPPGLDRPSRALVPRVSGAVLAAYEVQWDGARRHGRP